MTTLPSAVASTSLLGILLIFIASCNGQVRTELPKNTSNELKTTTNDGHLKLIKNHFTDQYKAAADNVHCALEDKNGNLWFGTTGDGVYRYDGKTFTNFTTKDGMNSNTVWSILEDKAGNIWFGTNAGACRYDGKSIQNVQISLTTSVFLYPNNTSNPSEKNDVSSMMLDKNGIIWFGTSKGVYCYNGTFFKHFLDNKNIQNEQKISLKDVQCMLEDKAGNIWFGSGPMAFEGLCRYDGKTLVSLKPNGDEWIRYIQEDKNGKIWFGGRLNGNFSYDGKNFSKFTQKIDIGNAILADKAGNIWFTGEEVNQAYESKNGVWCYDGNTFKNYSTKDGMGQYFVYCILEDKNGNIWFGTRHTNLYKYDGKTFTKLSE